MDIDGGITMGGARKSGVEPMQPVGGMGTPLGPMAMGCMEQPMGGGIIPLPMGGPPSMVEPGGVEGPPYMAGGVMGPPMAMGFMDKPESWQGPEGPPPMDPKGGGCMECMDCWDPMKEPCGGMELGTGGMEPGIGAMPTPLPQGMGGMPLALLGGVPHCAGMGGTPMAPPGDTPTPLGTLLKDRVVDAGGKLTEVGDVEMVGGPPGKPPAAVLTEPLMSMGFMEPPMEPGPMEPGPGGIDPWAATLGGGE